jgi:hypothetical protein
MSTNRIKVEKTNQDDMLKSLGISTRRCKEITTTVEQCHKTLPDARFSELAAAVSTRLELTQNEIFFLGYMFGGEGEHRLIMQAFEESILNIDNGLLEGMPIVKGGAMA